MKVFAVDKSASHCKRYIHINAQAYSRDKRMFNRAYRRKFRQQVHGGLEATSEFQPGHRSIMTGWWVS